jgi:release factor glutamine methyltransferase
LVTASSAGDLVAIAARLRAAGCVFAEEEAQLLAGTASTADELAVMVDRRAAGIPLEHVLGWAEFCGLRIVLSDGVFVPRRRSEFLVRQAVAVARASRPDGQARTAVVDLCCGSGAVGLAVASVLHNADLYVTDIEPTAVACARANVAPVGGHIYQGDLYDSLPARLRGQVDLLVVNAPYVPTDEMALMPPEARLHEPAIALDGGPDGVTIHRRVAAGAPGWLAPDGHLLIETSTRQAELTAAAMTASGLAATVATDDDLEATVVIGARTGPRHSDGTV